MEKLEASYITGGITNNAGVGENSLAVPQKAKNELLYDLTILHLGIYPRKMKTYICTKTCTPLFIAAFSTIGKKPKCLSNKE